MLRIMTSFSPSHAYVGEGNQTNYAAGAAARDEPPLLRAAVGFQHSQDFLHAGLALLDEHQAHF
jgi:hypothetical protein